jgi:hypothetical protein
VADSILPFEALFNEAAMIVAYAVKKCDAMKKCGSSRASGFEDFRDRFMEQLAVGSKNILGVGIAMSDLCIEIGCWRRGVIGIMEFRVAGFPHGLTEISKLTWR